MNDPENEPAKTLNAINNGPYFDENKAMDAELITGAYYPDEFDEFVENGTTISTTLLNKYAHLMNYEALMLTLPKLPTPR